MELNKTNPLRKLPIGVQNFEDLRKGGYLYVDKTALIYRLVTMGKPYFLSRPRRFGKSLLLSTLEAYFKGKKDLFKGLDIEKLETEWEEYPVLHLSLNSEKYESHAHLEDVLERHLNQWEDLYGKDERTKTYSGRFITVIRKAYEKTGKQVVVLIDEYDKPLLKALHDDALQKEYRDTLMAFYTVLKDADGYLKFVFITGVTKFAQVGVFSTLNQLNDISLSKWYASLCGLTRTEIENTFTVELQELAQAQNITYEETMSELTRLYDGYRFCQIETEKLFNPFSVLKVLDSQLLDSYWFASGTPSFLSEMLQKTAYDLRHLEGLEVLSSSLTDYRVDFNNPVPMIYQSGYLTIKGYKKQYQHYILGYPNDEVKYGFLNFVAPLYTPISGADNSFYIGKFNDELWSGNVDAFLSRLRAFFADFPYELNAKTERHYQVVFYLVFKLLGQYVNVELQSCKGRADAVVRTSDYVYVFEFKLDGTAEEALLQINDRGYLIPFTADDRKLVKVGVSFSAEERNIDRWLIENESLQA